MNKIYLAIGRLPIRLAIEINLFVALGMILLALTFAGPAFAQPAPVADAELARAALAQSANAKYDAIGDCMKNGKDSQAQTTCVLSVALLDARGAGSAPAAVATAPVVVNAEPDSFGGWLGKAVFTVGSKLFDTVERLGPMGAQIYTARVNAKSTERIAEFQNATQQRSYAALENVSVAGLGATAGVGIAGLNALASAAGKPSSIITVTGNSGPVNTGGTLTFAPITSSYNPVTNPTPTPPRICTTSATGVLTCQGG